MASRDSTLVEAQVAQVAEAIRSGRVIPFLGAGVNLCERAIGIPRDPATQLPSSSELAEELAKTLVTVEPDVSHGRDLLRIAQHIVTFLDEGPLYERLHSIFAVDVPTTRVHQFVASLPCATCLNVRPENRFPLIVTTNYDDLMEKSLQIAGKAFDTVFFDPDGMPGGRFCHRNPNGIVRLIHDPNADPTPFCEQQPVVLKIHGTIDKHDRDHEGFVITEDQYIEYLAKEPLEKLLPSTLLAKLRNNHLLFLGYSLRDWNCRVFLRRLKGSSRYRYRSWAVMRSADESERQFWLKNGVSIFALDLNDFIDLLKRELDSSVPHQILGTHLESEDG